MPAMFDPHAAPHLGTIACAVPFASALAAAGVALAIGSDLSEAVFAGSMSGACPAFGLAAVASARRRPSGRMTAHLAVGALASILLLACYAYGRLAGYQTAEIRTGMSVVMLAFMAAALASAALDLSKARRGASAKEAPTQIR